MPKFSPIREVFLAQFLRKFSAAKVTHQGPIVVGQALHVYLQVYPWWVPVDEEINPNEAYDEATLDPAVASRKQETILQLREWIGRYLDYHHIRQDICRRISLFESTFNTTFCPMNHAADSTMSHTDNPYVLAENIAKLAFDRDPDDEERVEYAWKFLPGTAEN